MANDNDRTSNVSTDVSKLFTNAPQVVSAVSATTESKDRAARMNTVIFLNRFFISNDMVRVTMQMKREDGSRYELCELFETRGSLGAYRAAVQFIRGCLDLDVECKIQSIAVEGVKI